MPKRRKREHSPAISHDPIAISSSPSESGSAAALTDEEEVDQDPAAPTPYTASRFRRPAPAPVSTVIHNDVHEARSKPTFRRLDPTSNLPPEMSTTLPDAFTPSRRKGKRDYVSGGLADTVRNWVLQAATEASHQAGNEEREINVDEVTLDDSRRGILAREDYESEWLLVSAQPWDSRSLSTGTASRLSDSGKAVVRGNATSWTVPMRAAGGQTDLRVATYWDIGS
jgi:hypothetical protein